MHNVYTKEENIYGIFFKHDNPERKKVNLSEKFIRMWILL